jgi:HlyD family secretion protein
MKYIKTKWAAVVAIAALVAIVAAFSFGRGDKAQYFTAKAERGDIHDLVEATGTIDAVTTVQVGSQVSGTISQLYADFNSRVKKGQLVAQIEPSLFQGALLQAKADLQNATATAASARAELLKSKATAVQTAQDYTRYAALSNEGVVSQQQTDQAKATNDAAQAAVSSSEAQVNQALAAVKLKQAAVDVAQTNLDHTTIHAPIDGIVTARNVEVGQTVAASLQAPTLFNIAQDLTKMRVYANTDESDVGQIKPGQNVTFTVDAFPRDTFHGTVVQIRLNPTTVQNVVTYDTVIEFANPDMKLYPGMTAYVSIPVANATNTVKVPDGALRFKPDMQPQQLQAVYAKYGIRVGKAQADSQAQGYKAMPDTAIVWKLNADKSLEPVQVKTGITDHTFTEVAQVLHGSLNPGDQLAIGAMTAGQKPSASGAGPNPMRGIGR